MEVLNNMADETCGACGAVLGKAEKIAYDMAKRLIKPGTPKLCRACLQSLQAEKKAGGKKE